LKISEELKIIVGDNPTLKKIQDALNYIIFCYTRIADFIEKRRMNNEKCDSESDSRASNEKLVSDSVGGSEELSEKNIAHEKISELPNENIIGHLIVLNCGHNGSLRYAEINQYEKHLIEANIISR